MQCQYCNQEFSLKTRYIAKTCGCDEDDRLISYEKWYSEAFKMEHNHNDESYRLLSQLTDF